MSQQTYKHQNLDAVNMPAWLADVYPMPIQMMLAAWVKTK